MTAQAHPTPTRAQVPARRAEYRFSMGEALTFLGIAVILWAVVFGFKPVNVWISAPLVLGALMLAVGLRHRSVLTGSWLRASGTSVIIGVLSGFVLYGICWAGHAVLVQLVPVVGGWTEALYAEYVKGTNRVLASVLIVLVLAPAEEILFRGLLQTTFAERFGPWGGILLAALCYALVQAATLSPLLVGMALLCGTAWGWLRYRFDSLLPAYFSHAVWDVAILMYLPLVDVY